MSDNEHSIGDSDPDIDSLGSESIVDESEIPDEVEEQENLDVEDDIPIEDGELDDIDALEENLSDAENEDTQLSSSILNSTEATSRIKITNSYMTKYEFTHMIGIRAAQIEDGSQVLVDTDKVTPMEIAIEELAQKQIPLIIRRTIKVSGKVTHEDWRIDEFDNIEILINHYK
jgi:DNA-directed RNA polymerase subunit K/omega